MIIKHLIKIPKHITHKFLQTNRITIIIQNYLKLISQYYNLKTISEENITIYDSIIILSGSIYHSIIAITNHMLHITISTVIEISGAEQ